MSGCNRDDAAGGPHHTQEICRKCGKTWSRRRGGSWDWEYQDCSLCLATTLPEEMDKIKVSMQEAKEQLQAEQSLEQTVGAALSELYLIKRMEVTAALDTLRTTIAGCLNCHKDLVDALNASEARAEELEKEKELLAFQVKLLEEGRKAAPNLHSVIDAMHGVMNTSQVLSAENFLLSQALLLIASSESRSVGDVVDIAKQALLRIKKAPKEPGSN